MISNPISTDSTRIASTYSGNRSTRGSSKADATRLKVGTLTRIRYVGRECSGGLCRPFRECAARLGVRDDRDLGLSQARDAQRMIRMPVR